MDLTKEEAKKYIKSKMCNNCGVYLGGGKCRDNCKVIEAIKALQEPCEDCISRQAVIDLLNTAKEQGIVQITVPYLEGIIKQLPSVNPQ